MIILRQKIFVNYSGYRPEDIEKIKAARSEQAKRLIELRKQAMTRMNNSNAFSRGIAENELGKIKDLNLGNRNANQVGKSILENYQNSVQTNMQARNAAYEQALRDSAKFRSKLENKYKTKRTLPVMNTVMNNKTNITTPQKQGMGTMGKVAIGAGVAAAGYGAYRLLKARKERKEAEEENEGKRRRL